jgi:hypothetical protein
MVPASIRHALAAAALATAWLATSAPAGAPTGAPEPLVIEPQLLPLAGPAASPEAEISALCWCGDRLVLMPQHPERFGAGPGELGFFVLEQADLEAFLDGRAPGPLTPRAAVLEAPGLIDALPGWDGLEAAASRGDTVYMAVEARVDGVMAGYLLRGHITRTDDSLRLRIDPERVASIPVPTNLPNMSQEALVLAPDHIGVIFEANGEAVIPEAHVAVFDLDLTYRGPIPLDHVEYRVTDACQPAADGRFWVINYFFPPEGDLLVPPRRPAGPVEQLVELRFDGERVVRTDAPAIDLRRDPSLPARNWEAMVRLEGRGFLLMTDRYPTTLLAFVPLPEDDDHE